MTRKLIRIPISLFKILKLSKFIIQTCPFWFIWISIQTLQNEVMLHFSSLFTLQKQLLKRNSSWKVSFLFIPFSFPSHLLLFVLSQSTQIFQLVYHTKVIAIDIYIQSLRLKIARLSHTDTPCSKCTGAWFPSSLVSSHHVILHLSLGFGRKKRWWKRFWKTWRMEKGGGERTRMKKAILSTFQ